MQAPTHWGLLEVHQVVQQVKEFVAAQTVGQDDGNVCFVLPNERVLIFPV